MSTANSTQYHPQDLVSQLAHDPDQADVLFTLLVLSDASTPKGAAFRKEAMRCTFVYTHEGERVVEDAAAKVAA